MDRGVIMMQKKCWVAIKNWISQKTGSKFFAYFIVGNMLVAGVIGSVLYFCAAHSLALATIDANQNMLVQLNKSSDLLLTQVDRYLNQLSMDTNVENFMHYYKSNDIIAQIQINNSLNNNLILNNDYIKSISIYYFKENKVFTINKGIVDVSDYEDQQSIQKIKGNRLNYTYWMPTRKIVGAGGHPINVITIVKSIPCNSFEPTAVAIVNISESYLRDTMNSIVNQAGLEIDVIDDQGCLISSNKGMNIDLKKDRLDLRRAFQKKSGYYVGKYKTKKSLISFVTSESYGWKYIGIIPYKTVVESIGFIRNYALGCSILAIIFGILVSMFFSQKISKPLNVIAGLFKNNEKRAGESDVLIYIAQNVSNILARNENIEKMLAEHLPVLRNNFLSNLLMGPLNANRKLQEGFQYYGIHLKPDCYYMVYLVSLDNNLIHSSKVSEWERNMMIIDLIGILNDMPIGECQKIVVNSKAEEITVILAMPSDETNDSIERQIIVIGNQIQQAVRANAKYDFTVTCGDLKKELNRVPDSYHEALEALRYRILLGNNKIIRYREIQNLNAENYSYPYHKERELIEALKQGDSEEVTRASQQIFGIFLNCTSALGETVYYYYMQLLSSAIKCAMEIGISLESLLGSANLYKELLKCGDASEVQDWFTYLFKELCEQIQKRKFDKNHGVVESIVEYIREHYDQDLSLTNLSRQVYLSVPYLSTLFRAEYGKSLKQYINEVRIAKAKEFLANADLQINDVAQKVGYDKVHAFLRLFKDYTGMTPGQYRKSIIFGASDNLAMVISQNSANRG
jgi:two-component system, response regulator YesN